MFSRFFIFILILFVIFSSIGSCLYQNTQGADHSLRIARLHKIMSKLNYLSSEIDAYYKEHQRYPQYNEEIGLPADGILQSENVKRIQLREEGRLQLLLSQSIATDAVLELIPEKEKKLIWDDSIYPGWQCRSYNLPKDMALQIRVQYQCRDFTRSRYGENNPTELKNVLEPIRIAHWSVERYYQEHTLLPGNNRNLDLPEPKYLAEGLTKTVAITPQGIIKAHFNDPLTGAYLQLRPKIKRPWFLGENTLVWQCQQAALPQELNHLVEESFDCTMQTAQIDTKDTLVNADLSFEEKPTHSLFAVHQAIERKQYSALREWIEGRTDLDQELQGKTALCRAITAKSEEALRILLKANLDVEKACSAHAQKTPLMLAATADDETLVDLLLHAGAQQDTIDSEGRTALIHAARENSVQATYKLSLFRYYLEHQDNLGCIAADYAHDHGTESVIYQLLLPEQNSDFHQQLKTQGRTAECRRFE